MKVLQKTALLILISSCFFTMQAGRNKYNNSYKPNYNGSDLRQQKQHMHQLEKHFKNMNIGKSSPNMSQMEQLEKQFQKMSIDKSDQDNQSRKETSLRIHNLSYAQKTILMLLAAMLIAATVTTTETVQKIKTHKIPHFDWNNKTKIYGPCEMLHNNSRLCCDIQSNYVVECCIGKDTTEKTTEDLICLSFDVEGIIGNQPEEDLFDYSAAFKEAKELCTKRKHHFNIILETTTLLEKSKPKYLQNVNDTECIIQRSSVNAPHITFPVAYPLSCEIDAISIGGTEILPSLNFVIKRLSEVFNLSKKPPIFIYNKTDCRGLSEYGIISLTENNNDGTQKKIMAVMLTYETLIKDFDEEIEETLAHEIFHLKQFEISKSLRKSVKTGNTLEVEADITSPLVTQNPCFVFAVRSDKFPIPRITKKNVNEELEGIWNYDYRYPPASARKFLVLLTHKTYKRVREILIMAERGA